MNDLIAVRGVEQLTDGLVSALRKLEPSLFQHVFNRFVHLDSSKRRRLLGQLIVPSDTPMDGTNRYLLGLRLISSNPEEIASALLAD